MKLQACNINKSFSKKPVLRDISFDIFDDGIGIVGPNGAGKSTLIRIISNLILPDTGYIHFYDNDENNIKPKIAVLLEGNRNIYQFLTVFENIKYFYLLNSKTSKPDLKKIDYFLDYFELGDCKNERAGTLSKGMLQKLSILLLFLNDPDVIILDEPTLGLDIIASLKMKELLKKIITDYQKMIILCSHDCSVIQEITKRIIILKEGKIYYDGQVSAIPLLQKSVYSIIYNGIFTDKLKAFTDTKKIKCEIDGTIYKFITENLEKIFPYLNIKNIIKIENTSADFENILQTIYLKKE